MLREIPNARQVPGEAHRRWFSGSEFDLLVWSGQDRITGFQLCYGKPRAQHALTWHEGKGFLHTAVDDGETRSGKHKGAPLLVLDGAFDANAVLTRFLAHSSAIDPAIAGFVADKLREAPSMA